MLESLSGSLGMVSQHMAIAVPHSKLHQVVPIVREGIQGGCTEDSNGKSDSRQCLEINQELGL